MYDSEKIEDITDGLKKYVNTNLEIIKLETTERASVAGSILLTGIIIGLILFLVLCLFSIGIGFYISDLLQNSYGGFLIVAGFYLIITLILIPVRKKIFEHPLRDKIIRLILSDKDD